MFATSSSHPIRAAVTAAAMSVTALFAPWNASAQELADAKQPPFERIIEKLPSTFTPRECGKILSVAEEVFRVVGHKYEGYNPEFPITLAKFIAPGNHMLVHELLTTRGEFDRLLKSTAPADAAKRATLRLALTCDGPKEIVTNEHGAAMFGVIRRNLLDLPQPISLQRAGVRDVSPQVVGSLVSPAAPKGLQGPDLGLGGQRLKLH